MKKGLIFATTLAMALGVGVAVGAHQEKAPVKTEAVSAGETVYLHPGVWEADSAWFAMYTYGGTAGEAWTAMSAVAARPGYYSATVPANSPNVIFCRMNPAKTIEDKWDGKWNQSADLSFQSDKDLYNVTDWATGTWGSYVAPEFHLVGGFNSWTAAASNLLTVDPEDANHYSISGVAMEKNDELKIHDTANDEWFDNGAGNIVVSEDGTYDVDFYVHVEYGDPIVLTKQAVEPVYTIVNRGNAPVTFVLDEDEKPEGVKHQYSAEVQYAKRSGDLKFYANGVEITSGIGVDWDAEHDCPVPGNNVYGDSTNGFYLAHTVNYSGLTKIYLKTYEDGGISLWANGYANNEFYSFIRNGQGGGSNVTLTLDTTFEPDETYIRQYKTSSAVAIKALAGTDWDTSFSLDCSGLSEDVTPEAGATNNARQAFQSSAWKVHNDCEEVIYVKEKKTDLSLWLYVGGYEEAHVLTIGGKNVSLHKVAENKYAATGVSLTAGDTVTAYTIEGVAQTVSAEVVGNNNLDSSKKVLVTNASADIYFNTQTSELWISGLPSGGYHLYKNSSSVVQMTATEDYGEYKQWKTESVSFAVGDTVEILDTNGEAGVKGPVVWTITNFEESPMSVNFEVKDGKIKCKTACITSVYLKLKYEDDRIYFGAEAQYITKAREFANSFKSAMATACSAEGKKDAVEEAWAAQATAFAALVKEAQDELKLGSYSSVEEVRDFGERYVAIKQQHSTWTLANFLSWDIPASSRFAGLDEFNATDSNAMIIVIAIAAISALAFTTLLVLKKRKQR